MKIIKFIFKMIFWLIEKISSNLAAIAALLSTAMTGNYFDRIWKGMYSIAKALYFFVFAYIKDQQFDKFVVNIRTGIDAGIDSMSANLKDDPQTVLAAMVATFAFYKIIAIILRVLRKKASRKKVSKEDQQNQTTAYAKLYNDDN